MPTDRDLHLNVNVLGSGSHAAAWRVSENGPFGSLSIHHYQQIAKIAERGMLDAVFLADALAVAPNPKLGPSWALDPMTVIAGMAAVTERIGFVATASTTYNHPYSLARTVSSLDHISSGRMGWNVVTTHDDRVAANFGQPLLPEKDSRYDRATEFVDVVRKLWDSWEEGALVGDTSAGLYADPDRIHAIDHSGDHYAVSGPFQLPRSRQGRPLLVQAGGSEGGRDLAALHADAVFCAQQIAEKSKLFRADIRRRAQRFGRDPDAIAILPGLLLSIGSTEAEANARKRDLDGLAGDDRVVERFLGRFGITSADVELDSPIPETLLRAIATSTKGPRGFAEAARDLAEDRSLTVRQFIERGGGGHRLVVGVPEQIADTIEDWFRSGAADGFNIMLDVFPDGLERFVDTVVPILQSRGLFRREYESATLRGHYGLFPEVHCASEPRSQAN
ncbi:MAG: LLM class flavin-dependent oxidoreductase [Rhizobiaceae bacterium]|nr:LLM class flavin-dependent oxidoreductase [Rhizobiaceae bacterium]